MIARNKKLHDKTVREQADLLIRRFGLPGAQRYASAMLDRSFNPLTLDRWTLISVYLHDCVTVH